MASKTPRTMIGEYINASYTQTTKTSRVQSRVTETPESPRSPSWVRTSQGKSPFANQRKSPGKSLLHNRVASLQAKRKNVSINEEVTPRTLITTLIEGSDSTLPLVRQRKRTSQTGVASSVPAVLKDTERTIPSDAGRLSVSSRRRNSFIDKETPRTMIQNFILNASDAVETPLVNFKRHRTKDFISPVVSIPSSLSYQTPSPFKTSLSDKSSNYSTNRSLAGKTLRRTPRPHAPIIIDGHVRKSPRFSNSPGNENVPGSYHTPSPFKSPMSDEDMLPEQRQNRRLVNRKTHKGNFLFNISPNTIEKEHTTDEIDGSKDSGEHFTDEGEQDFEDAETSNRNISHRSYQENGRSKNERSYRVDERLNDRSIDTTKADTGDRSINSTKAEHSYDPDDGGDSNNELEGQESLEDPDDRSFHNEDRSSYRNDGKIINEAGSDYESHTHGSRHSKQYREELFEAAGDYESPTRGLRQSRHEMEEFDEAAHGSRHSRHEREELVEVVDYESPSRGSSHSRHDQEEFVEAGSDYDSPTHESRHSGHDLEESVGAGSDNESPTHGLRHSRHDREQLVEVGSNYESPSRGTRLSRHNQEEFNEAGSGNESPTGRSISRRHNKEEFDEVYNEVEIATGRREISNDDQDVDDVEEDVRDEDEESDEKTPAGAAGYSYDQGRNNIRSNEGEHIDGPSMVTPSDADRDENESPDEEEKEKENNKSYSSHKDLELSFRRRSLKSGLNRSSVVPDNFEPAFTSTQHPPTNRNEEEMEDDQMEFEDEPEVELVIPVKKKAVRKPRKKSVYTLPVSLVKKKFTHFAGMRVSKEAVEEVMKISEEYWDNLALDLESYAKHAGRKRITLADFHLLFKRQGLVHEKQCLNSLIEKYLPMEERRKLIPVARAGNRIEPE